jgi:hypothetical protein
MPASHKLYLHASVTQTILANSALHAQVRSRTFSEVVNSESVTLMVPYADFANHSFAPNTYFTVTGPKYTLLLARCA